jgi:hypothetical protein
VLHLKAAMQMRTAAQQMVMMGMPAQQPHLQLALPSSSSSRVKLLLRGHLRMF